MGRANSACGQGAERLATPGPLPGPPDFVEPSLGFCAHSGYRIFGKQVLAPKNSSIQLGSWLAFQGRVEAV